MIETRRKADAQMPVTDFARIMEDDERSSPDRSKANVRFEVNPEEVKNGLGRLVLALVNLLHELLERQALRRIDNGSLDDDLIEQVGVALMRQAEEIERLRKVFNLDEEDLNLDLGPLGRLI